MKRAELSIGTRVADRRCITEVGTVISLTGKHERYRYHVGKLIVVEYFGNVLRYYPSGAVLVPESVALEQVAKIRERQEARERSKLICKEAAAEISRVVGKEAAEGVSAWDTDVVLDPVAAAALTATLKKVTVVERCSTCGGKLLACECCTTAGFFTKEESK